jgi:phage gp36-like protein
MPYITHQQLHERPGARELSEVASDEHKPMVAYELMELTLLSGDRSDYSSDDIALADEALARIDDAVTDAGGLIDGYLRKGGYTLPVSPVPRLLTVWCRAIARYFLHQHRRALESNDTIVRDYRDALKLLQQVADGKLGIGADDNTVEIGIGEPLIKAGCRPVRDALRDF